MAGPGGPAADVNVGTDVLAAVARPTDAVKALRREIKAAKLEMVELQKAGKTFAATELGARIKVMELQTKSVGEIMRRQREIDNRSRRALDVGTMFKSVVGAQAIKNILQGELDARGLVGLAIMSERTIAKAARQLGGVKFSNFARGLIKAAPFVGEGINSVIEGISAIRQHDKNREHIMSLVKGGKISWAEGRLHLEEAQKFSLVNDPDKLASNIGSSADKLISMSRANQEKALSAVKYKYGRWTKNPAYALPYVEVIEGNVDAKKFVGRYSELLSAAANQGQIIDDRRRRQLIGEALVETVENSAERDKVAEAIHAAVTKFQAEDKDNGPETIKKKFRLDETRRREAVEAKRWIIPARLEF